MSTFDQPGVVSVWLFLKPEDPADAGKDVLKHFCGVDYYDLDSQEINDPGTATPLAELLEPLSYSASFRQEALAEAERVGAGEAYGVLAQYDFAYDPTRVTRPVTPDPMFLGTFGWHE